MKKFITTILISILCFNILGYNLSFADENDVLIYSKEAITYQNELKKTSKGKTYIALVDGIIEQYKDNQKELVNLKNKFSTIDLSKINNSTLKNTFGYLESKVNLALIVLQGDKKDVLSLNISQNDKDYIDKKIVELQKNIIEGLESSLIKLNDEINKNNNRKETGNMKINMSMDEDTLGQLKTNIELNEYTAITNGFDSQVTGRLKVLFEMASQGEEINFELDSFMDIITKEGTFYFIFKDLKLEDKYKGIDDIMGFFDILKEQALKNQYIKYEDIQTQNIFNMLNALDYKSLSNDIKSSFDSAMLEAYKTEGNKYYLRPTKYACDSYKKMLSKFDPFYGSSCSNSQYNDMLEAFSELGRVYISIDSDNITTLGYEGFLDAYTDENKGYISFTNNKIVEYSYSLIPSQQYNPGEYFNISYKDGIIKGGLIASSYLYDYENNEYLDSTIKVSINGTSNDNGEVDNLKIAYSGTDENNNQYLTGEFNINSTTFNYSHSNNSFRNKTSIIASGTVDNDQLINDLNLKIDVQNKKGTFDYDTWEYKYEDTYSKAFTTDFKISNKKINGTMNFYGNTDSNPVATLTSTGEYSSNKMSLNNRLELSNDLSNNLLGYNGTLNHKIIGNFNFSYDATNNKNNLYMIFDFSDNARTIFMYEIDNIATVESGTTSPISTPSNSIDLEEAFDITLPSLYY